STHCTPCPACRDQGKPWHPHGQWDWDAKHPDQMKCQICGTVFPNEKYGESVTLRTSWGQPQTFTFFGGEPMVVFSYKTSRPSFSGYIRSRKVEYMCGAANDLAEAYLLFDEPRYARACRLVLLRLAEVYPHWLVHSGYGEIADIDPRIAAAKIKQLPADELVYPPNKPDRQLHTGYWS